MMFTKFLHPVTPPRPDLYLQGAIELQTLGLAVQCPASLLEQSKMEWQYCLDQVQASKRCSGPSSRQLSVICIPVVVGGMVLYYLQVLGKHYYD